MEENVDLERSLFNAGYKRGVYDQNHGINSNLSVENVGSFFKNGYDIGYEEASSRSWYIVAVNSQRYLVDGGTSSNSWTNQKSNATTFKTKEEAERRYIQLTNSVGRGSYKVAWEKSG